MSTRVLVNTLRWKLRFLRDPADSLRLDRTRPLARSLGRRAAALSFVERFDCAVRCRNRGDLLERLIRDHVATAEDGEPYFEVGELRIFFRPPELAATDPELVRGVSTILKEAYLEPTYFFSSRVQIREGDVVLDVGAHLGTSAMLFSRHAGSTGRVFSFEPVYHALLHRNLRENRIEGVEVVPSAVADRVGEIELAVSPRGVDSRIAGTRSIPWPREPSPVTTLDEFVEERALSRVDFIKMDIEGAEELALRGARGILARFRPRLSIASYHTDPSGERQHPKLLQFLLDLDYQVEPYRARHIYAW